jgi:hypothetical protein
MEKTGTHEVEELVREALEKSWQFVKTDPVLFQGDTAHLRDRLSRRVEQLAHRGERDVWRLANGAISELRRDVAQV